MLVQLEGEELQAFEFLRQRLVVHMEERKTYERLATIECVLEDVLEVINEVEEVILPAPAALDDTPPQVKDLVEKVNLETEEEPMEVGLIHVRKKNGKIRVCVDYRDLNKATPKDVYPMPVADMLIDAVVGHEMLSFMDGTAGYHQILVAKADRHKTTFHCPAFIGAFEYVVMPFGMKNVGATYQ
ncbi:hypothetical protein ACLB2K_015468 [Fragaria x ananassa]